MTDAAKHIIERFQTTREYTAGDVSNYLRTKGVVMGELLAEDMLMNLVEDGVLRVEYRSGIKCFWKAEDGDHQSLRLTIKEAAERHGFSITALRGPKRHRSLVHCRQEAMANAFALGFSYSEIGRAVNRDRNTVADGIRSYEARQKAVLLIEDQTEARQKVAAK